MPTENRSSNTEQMVSVPRDEVERLVKLLQYQAHPYPSPHAEFWQGLLDAPAAQHQVDPIVVEAVAVTREDADEGLRLEWLLEGGIAALELPGQVLLVAHGTVTDDNGSGEIYRHPPTSDGFSAGDMADQGAKAFAARDGEVEELRARLVERDTALTRILERCDAFIGDERSMRVQSVEAIREIAARAVAPKS